mmetsp:Transcript_45957/g.107441  ORF Transcript_45957/g.107441 Transcript_45957/m.107441 type:complete len:397 (-) Transcript_45957:164-1354(-)
MLPGTWLKWLVAFTAWQCHNAVFQEFAKEAEALEALKKDKALASKVENAEVSQLIRNGWWQLCRELVLTSHGLPGFGSLEKAVRQEVTQLKLNADDLLLSLSPQDDSRIGVVRCATQWAQNSSAIFLSIKFAHRWSSPGALKVQDEKIEVSPCCFNFTASGDHSQLKKRYALDLAFYGEVDPDHWSWQLASAGRMTTEIRKRTRANWPRLLESKSKPGNLQQWDSMQERWKSELKEFDRQHKAAAKDAESTEGVEAAEEEIHSTGRKKCVDSRASPFSSAGLVTRLCEAYWPVRMETKKKGKSSTWLVLFHSPSEMKCYDRGDECQRVKDRWEAVGRKVEQVSEALVGAVDCDRHADLCQKEKVGKLPFVRRYRNGKKKTYYGEWDIDSIMKIVVD